MVNLEIAKLQSERQQIWPRSSPGSHQNVVSNATSQGEGEITTLLTSFNGHHSSTPYPYRRKSERYTSGPKILEQNKHNADQYIARFEQATKEYPYAFCSQTSSASQLRAAARERFLYPGVVTLHYSERLVWIGAHDVLTAAVCHQRIDDSAIAIGYLFRNRSSKGQGLGRLLLMTALEEAERYEDERVYLEVMSRNTYARQLYESIGFTYDETHTNTNDGSNRALSMRLLGTRTVSKAIDNLSRQLL